MGLTMAKPENSVEPVSSLNGGNPTGRKPGERPRASMAAESLPDGEVEGRARGDDILIIDIEGGLPPPAPLHAGFLGRTMSPDDGEDEQAFRRRAIAAAMAAGSPTVAFCTIPPPPRSDGRGSGAILSLRSRAAR
jgi:hypothetical protein